MAQFITVSAGGAKGGTKPVAKVRLGNRTIEIKSGEIRKGIELPCEVYSVGTNTVRVTNTTGTVIRVASAKVDPKKSIKLNDRAWTEVTA